jgi:hypothetical protein
MRSERPYQPSRGRRVAARASALRIALDLAIVLGMWLHGPLQLEAGSLPFGLSVPNSLFVLPGLAFVWCALSWRNWRSWLGLRPEHVMNWRRVPLSAWLVIPLSIALLSAQVRDLPEHAVSVTNKVRKAARKGPAGMSINGANKHAAPLVRRLVQRPSSDPVVVWIDDLDRRGHTAAFYLYPRLMLMEPDIRRFTLRQRMTLLGGANPYFRIGPGSSMLRSRQFAKERGAEFIFAGREGERQPKP